MEALGAFNTQKAEGWLPVILLFLCLLSSSASSPLLAAAVEYPLFYYYSSLPGNRIFATDMNFEYYSWMVLSAGGLAPNHSNEWVQFEQNESLNRRYERSGEEPHRRRVDGWGSSTDKH